MEENGTSDLRETMFESSLSNGDTNGNGNDDDLSDTHEDETQDDDDIENDKENQIELDNGDNDVEDIENLKPSYLMYEDFSHESLGYETYSDGMSHPVELRRILTGDLSTEMSVSVRSSAQEKFKVRPHSC